MPCSSKEKSDRYILALPCLSLLTFPENVNILNYNTNNSTVDNDNGYSRSTSRGNFHGSNKSYTTNNYEIFENHVKSYTIKGLNENNEINFSDNNLGMNVCIIVADTINYTINLLKKIYMKQKENDKYLILRALNIDSNENSKKVTHQANNIQQTNKFNNYTHFDNTENDNIKSKNTRNNNLPSNISIDNFKVVNSISEITANVLMAGCTAIESLVSNHKSHR